MNAPIELTVAGVSILGPGLPGWAASRPVLAGEAPWRPAPFTPPAPALLPATERRRTSPSVRLALAAAAEAVTDSGLPPEELETIFASSNGDGQIVGAILEALTAEDGVISPTQFHNSVHNAAAGYWGIAVGSQRPSVSVGGHDHVFAAGLLQAAGLAAASGEPILLCVYDAPMPPPLDATRRTEVPFATALVLAPGPARAGRPRLSLRYQAEPAPPPPPAVDVFVLMEQNPVARALPLLAALAAGHRAELLIPLLEDARLAVRVTP